MAQKKPKIFDFEANMQELAEIVEKIEGGELSLEEAMQEFEKGVKLTKNCHVALQTAEQKVKILLEQAGNYTLEEFADPENDDADKDD
ncbi:MAG: exodeoxyribonuclease VII small subunit [Gammaproteobacteria bacterium]|nr:exodeoxyribonuclease VII small subunit [Gammaproteobacteria bacterium]